MNQKDKLEDLTEFAEIQILYNTTTHQSLVAIVDRLKLAEESVDQGERDIQALFKIATDVNGILDQNAKIIKALQEQLTAVQNVMHLRH